MLHLKTELGDFFFYVLTERIVLNSVYTRDRLCRSMDSIRVGTHYLYSRAPVHTTREHDPSTRPVDTVARYTLYPCSRAVDAGRQ